MHGYSPFFQIVPSEMAHYVYSQKQIVDCLAVPMIRKLVAELQDGFQK